VKKREHPEIQANYRHHMDYYHPPLLPMPDIPVCLHYGAYMVKRRHDVHTGIDLYTPKGSLVYAVEDGDIICIRKFTGTSIGYDWWNETQNIDIEGYTGCLGYGEIEPDPQLKVGDIVKKGQVIGKVIPVLKEDRGRAMSMLHFSIHRHCFGDMIKAVENKSKENFYDLQIDPTMLLIQMKHKADIIKIADSMRIEVAKI